MVSTRRLAVLRLVVLVALVVSAAMTVEHLYPDQSFCPLEEACERAHASELGVIAGIPTAVVGLAAFTVFFGLTLLHTAWARHLVRPAGLLAALAGLAFVGYQAYVLRSYCPLCLVVDGAAILAGAIAVTLPVPSVRLSGWRLGLEVTSARVAWLLAALLAMIAPFAWPRPPAATGGQWVELAGPVLALEDEEPAVDHPAPAATPAATPQPPPERASAPPPDLRPAPSSPTDAEPAPAPAAPAPAPRAPAPLSAPSDETLASVSPNEPAAAAPPAEAAPEVAPAPLSPVTVIEYLNPYCKFCRATHRRLEAVLATNEVEVRIRRIYAWGGKGYPAWAKACAYAATQGREDVLFAELLHSRGQQASEIYAAARRAGLDPRALRLVMMNPVPPARLVRDRKLVQRARLQGLPTLDIGMRRLMGEQSEADLRAALDAAARMDPR